PGDGGPLEHTRPGSNRDAKKFVLACNHKAHLQDFQRRAKSSRLRFQKLTRREAHKNCAVLFNPHVIRGIAFVVQRTVVGDRYSTNRKLTAAKKPSLVIGIRKIEKIYIARKPHIPHRGQRAFVSYSKWENLR